MWQESWEAFLCKFRGNFERAQLVSYLRIGQYHFIHWLQYNLQPRSLFNRFHRSTYGSLLVTLLPSHHELRGMVWYSRYD
jgi:hypothetical protein